VTRKQRELSSLLLKSQTKRPHFFLILSLFLLLVLFLALFLEVPRAAGRIYGRERERSESHGGTYTAALIGRASSW
jgi:hypothetical protein